MKTAESIHRRRCESRRSGVATIEFALVLPALVALTIGTIDICSMLFLKESATLAAYEGARRGVARDRTNADATARVMEFLDDRGIQYSGANVVTFGSPSFDDADTLEHVTITVNVPAAGNLLIPSQMFGDMTLSANVTMRKEYRNLNVSN